MQKFDNIKQMIERIKTKISELRTTLKEGDVLELEARVGCLRDLQSDNRVFIPTDFPVVYNSNTMYIFGPGITKNDYTFFLNEIKKLVEEEKDQTTFEIKSKEDITLTGSKSRYTLVDKKITEHIRKTKLVVFDIYIPNSVYDIRISLCKEEKMPISEGITEKTFKRERDRISYVNSNGISYEFSHVRSTHLKENMEVEMEMTTFDEELKKVDTFFTKVFDFLCRRVII